MPALVLRDCIVFDIGGTNLRAGRYDPETRDVSALISRSTPSHWTMPGATAQQIQRRLLEETHSAAQLISGGSTPDAIAVAFPGPIDADGTALSAPTVWGDRDKEPFPLRRELRQIWPTSEILVMNDVTAAGYRYLRRPEEDFCIVTVSSGIGSKTFVSGSPLLGVGARGGEIGHMRVDFSRDSVPCDCGGRGHLGAIASGRGAVAVGRQLALEEPREFCHSRVGEMSAGNPNAVDTKMIVAAFIAGDAWAAGLIRLIAQPLGRTLAGIHSALGIERFVVYGGFALALGEAYRRELVKAAADGCWNIGQNWDTSIELGINDDLSGLLGAGRYASEMVMRPL